MKSNLATADGKGVVQIEDRVDAHVDDVWAALTDRERLAVWLGEFDCELGPGGRYHARYHASGWEGDARIEVFDPPHRLLARTQNGTWEVMLADDGDATVVTWEQRGTPAEHLAAYGVGIQIHVRGSRRLRRRARHRPQRSGHALRSAACYARRISVIPSRTDRITCTDRGSAATCSLKRTMSALPSSTRPSASVLSAAIRPCSESRGSTAS